MQNVTFYDKLQMSGGRPSGFDYMRLCLSVAVIVSHAGVLSYGKIGDTHLWNSPIGPVFKLILPMFFALSGYLVTGSFQRSYSLIQFLGLRLIRIYPALIVEVMLSAFLLGPALTTLPLHSYFTDTLFLHYLLNVTGDIHYLLPGLFATNPYPNVVNPQLWTVPFELFCYIAISILMLLGLKRYPGIAIIAAFGVSAAYILGELVIHHGVLGTKIGAVHGSTLVSSFLFGVSLYLYHKIIPWRPSFCVISGILGTTLLYNSYGEYLSVLFISYFTISLGLINPRKVGLLRGADYSYGIFLYGAVIQQALMAVFPGMRIWWANIILSVPIALAIAALSWHFIEKPALQLKRYLPKRPAHSL